MTTAEREVGELKLECRTSDQPTSIIDSFSTLVEDRNGGELVSQCPGQRISCSSYPKDGASVTSSYESRLRLFGEPMIM